MIPIYRSDGNKLSDQWLIYKNGQATGPLTAAAIRSSLRDGVLDPFDLVGRVGSPARRALVEVDEIFHSEHVGYMESGEETVGAGGLMPSPFALAERTRPGAAREEALAGQGPMHLAVGQAHAGAYQAASAAAAPAMGPRHRRNPKQFYVHNSGGRTLGPLAASEIQGLFLRGVLGDDVVVTREGSSSKVAVRKFLAASFGTATPKVPQVGAHPAMQQRAPARQPLALVAKKYEAQALVFGIGFAALLLLAAAVWLMATQAGLRQGPGNHNRRGQQQISRAEGRAVRSARPASRGASVKTSPKRSLTKASPRPAASRGLVVTPLRPQAAERAAGIERSSGRGRTGPAAERPSAQIRARRAAEVRLAERRRAVAAEQSRLAERRQSAAIRAAAARSAAERQRATAAQRARVAAASRAARAAQVRSLPAPLRTAGPRSSAPARAAASGPRRPSPSLVTLADGQTVTRLGPFIVDRAAVVSCAAACNVTLRGNGGTVQAAFFKGVWGNAMLSKAGGVYVSGIVRRSGGGTKILISNVQ